MRKKTSLAWVLILALCPGCGRDPSANAPKRISILGLSLEAGTHLREDALAAYAAKTGIEFDLVPTPGTSAEQLPLVLDLFAKRASTPDIYLIDGTWPGTMHEHFVDLGPHLNTEAQRHAQPLLKNNTVHGRLIALPLYMNNGILFYRADLLKKYGYSGPPETWKELQAMASRIQQGERRNGKRNFWGYIWQGGRYEGLTCNALEWQVASGGGHILESDGTITLDNAAAAEAMTTAASWIGSISPKSVLAYTEADAAHVFRSGNAAFMRHWSSAFKTVREGMAIGSAEVALLPAGSAGRAHAIGGFQLAVSGYSANIPESVNVVLHLTGIEVQTRRAMRRGYLPTYPELHRNPSLLQSLPQVEVWGKAPVETWVFRPASVAGSQYAQVSKAYYEKVHDILSGEVDAQRGLTEAALKLKQLTRVPADESR